MFKTEDIFNQLENHYPQPGAADNINYVKGLEKKVQFLQEEVSRLRAEIKILHLDLAVSQEAKKSME